MWQIVFFTALHPLPTMHIEMMTHLTPDYAPYILEIISTCASTNVKGTRLCTLPCSTTATP